jgi:ATP-binding cassette, subfamily B, bacterial PglK
VHDLNTILNQRQRLRLMSLLAGLVFAAGLELIGIASIPVFVTLLVEPDRLMAKLPEWAAGAHSVAMDPVSLTLLFAGMLAGFFVLKNVYIAGLAFLESRLLCKVTVANAIRLYGIYLYGPYVIHLQRNPAELMRNLRESVGHAVDYLRSTMVLLREGLVCLVVVLLLLLVDPVVSLSVFALLGVASTIFYLAVRRALTDRGERFQFHHERQMQVINEGLGAVKMIKLLGLQPHAMERFQHDTAELWQHNYFYRFVSTLPRMFLEVVSVSGILLVVALFIAFDREVNTMLPVLALLVVSVVRMIPAFNAIVASLSEMKYHRHALAIVAAELSSSENGRVNTDVAMPVLCRGIELVDVRFRYPGSQSESLCGVSIEIGVGEAVGIAGPTGAGKSTLVDIVLGLLQPDSGGVRVDGKDIRESLRAWQSQIGYVPQDIYLLDDTIRRNVAFGIADEEINDKAVADAVDAAQLREFLSTLPDGLETRVGNRGVRLSGGQRQRIGIARALYHSPPVLVMDEATSALDDETEEAVIEAISRLRGNRTIVIIAHRLSTLSTCDRVLHLMNGSLLRAA